MRSTSFLSAALLALCAAEAGCREPAPAPSPAALTPLLERPDGGPLGAKLSPLREPSPDQPGAPLACAEAWLGRHGLNEYGDAPGTMYAGGTPLFDPRTGARADRLEFLFARHPDLRADCAPHPR